jgi:hypothetical protein
MLNGLAVFAAITALIAGILGAWSPCGFSMVDTIGTALGDARRASTLGACATFAVGAVLGGAVTYGGIALAGRLVGSQVSGLREALGAVLALAAAIADWRGVKIAPQIRRQVPERWRWTMPLPLACGLYGVLLGLGFTTFVLSFAVWALAGISFAAGSPALGVLVGVAFGVGRALPVLWIAPGLHRGGAQRLDGMAAEPRLWLGLRRLDALGLGVCALFLGGASAGASARGLLATGATVRGPLATSASAAGLLATSAAAGLLAATDPSASSGDLVWQRVDGPGMLKLRSGARSVLPGSFPALGESSIAWQDGAQITVADLASMAPKLAIPVTGVDALAVSDSWVVYRDRGTSGAEDLIGVSLLDPSRRRYILGSRPVGEIGRPALDGARVLFTLDTPRRGAIETMNLDTSARRVVRSVAAGAALTNPASLRGRLVYERVGRCAQQLRIGSLRAHRRERVLLQLPSAVPRDPGYQRGYEHAYNSASRCPNRASGPAGRRRLGPIALSAAKVYVTVIPPNPKRARIVALRR